MKNKSLLIGIGLAVLGFLMLIIPTQIFKIAIVILGAISFLNGIIILKTERILIADTYYQKATLIRGISSIVIGFLVVCFPQLGIKLGETVWTITCYVFGIWLFVSTFLEIFGIIQLRRYNKKFKTYLIETIISFLVAILLFILGHNNGLTFILRIGGLVMLLTGLLFSVVAWKDRPVYVKAENVETVVDDEKSSSENTESSAETESNN